MEDMIDRLKEFHRKHRLPIGDASKEFQQFNLALLMEEVGELAGAINKRHPQKSVEGELLDVLYVAIGLGVALGCDLGTGLSKLHDRNMAKELSKHKVFQNG